ncbi:MAG: BolA family transcriptional regulator [Kordiimonas sp.]|nr:BolA family transcriptional regulator [Kordiimonas sp.]|tara:strand:- start:1912 stop:2187 length:276 start_codon:yes stop_codon:yes gene_type:complete
MKVAEAIRQKITAGLSPQRLDVIDESHKHAGHRGAPDGGESHFQIHIIADAFAGQSRLARQRMVYKLLAEELAGPVHALSLHTQTPDEAGA